MNRVSSRLASRTSTHQATLLARADAAADRAEAAVRKVWLRLLALLRRDPPLHPWTVHHELRPILAALHHGPADALRGSLTDIAAWGHEAAADAVIETTSLPALVRAAVHQWRGYSQPIREDVEPRALASLGIGPLGLQATDLLARLREPDVSKDEGRELLGKLLFPPLKLEGIAAILRRPILGKTWEQDWSAATKLADPNLVMGIVAGGLAAGQNPREIARTLQPVVQGVQSSARRIARTYGMQVAHHAQMQAHAQLGDLVIGYEVHSAKSIHSRKWHVTRDGTIYYLKPKAGQKGPAQCPHPPLEPEDPRERPAGAPHIAWNCMCWLSPVLRPLEE